MQHTEEQLDQCSEVEGLFLKLEAATTDYEISQIKAKLFQLGIKI